MASKSSSTERLVLVVAALIAVSGILASAWVAASTSTPDAPQVEDDVADRYGSIEGLAGTRTTTIERNGTVSSNRTHSIQMRPGTGEKRLSLVEGTDARYDRRVSNGSVLWLYDASTTNATRLRVDGVDADSTRGERLQRLFTRLNATGAEDERPDDPPTVEPLPVVPQAPAGQSPPGTVASGAPLAVEYVGTETVDDREVYVLRLTPAGESGAAEYEQTLWVDTERFFPLKQRTAWTHDGERTALTTTYRDVEFDPGIADSTFRPDFPANTTVRSPETPETTTYQGVVALRDATNVSVPDPEIHPSYELSYATRTEGRVSGVGLRYVNSTSVITVGKYDFTYATDEGDEQVRIDGRTGKLTYGHRVTLSWSCDTYRYTVRGTGVSADAIVDVGESIGCPDPDA